MSPSTLQTTTGARRVTAKHSTIHASRFTTAHMNPQLLIAIEQSPRDGYLRYHAPRYDTLLALLQQHYTGGMRVLDIGRSPFTSIAAAALGSGIDTLGFEPDQDTATGRNFQFDLNAAQHEATWRNDLPAYDVVLFTEVIEHLHTSPLLVLRFLRSILAPGGLLIIQTPNAVVLHKRLQMLLGRNPYNLIAENAQNPGHFREYTARELAGYCRSAGFTLEQLRASSYFDYRYSDHLEGRFAPKPAFAAINLFYRCLPASLRPGLCAVLRTRRVGLAPPKP